MKLSKLADYGTVILVQLAKQTPDRLTAKELADNSKLPLPTVSKLLKRFKQRKLVSATLGSKGGYALNCPAENISLAEIIQAVEGNTALTQCSLHTGICRIENHCQIRGNWQLINRVVDEALAAISLAELAQPMPIAPSIPISQVGYHRSPESAYG